MARRSQCNLRKSKSFGLLTGCLCSYLQVRPAIPPSGLWPAICRRKRLEGKVVIGKRNYGTNYGGSHPGDSLAFFVVILVIIGLGVAAYASIQ